MTADKPAKPVAQRRFKADVRKVLDLVVGSLYTHQEIFLRELISNASDALEKLRFEAVQNEDLYEGDGDLKIRVEYDAEAATLSVSDNGIGMSDEEIAMHLGTIAGSGTRHLLESMKQGGDAPELIGRFGVGFYAAFMVADRVVVESRRAGFSREQGVRWSSKGEGGYSLEALDRPKHGTRVTLHIKKVAEEFLDGTRLRGIVHRYSDHVGFPIFIAMDKGSREAQVNQGTALWTRPKQELNEREYHEFYRHLSHNLDTPLCHVHSRVEGKVEYTCLLYIPSEPPLLPHEQQQHHNVKLYVHRVFIMDRAADFLPPWLRFVCGIVDADGLPLNISRETLQVNREVEAIRQGCTRKVLEMLRRTASKDAGQYAKFWRAFGTVLKEGALEESPHRDDVIDLLRFHSTREDRDEPRVSLKDYTERMQAAQQEIYCLTADDLQTARHSPHLEMFKEQDLEVLLMTDAIDEWLVMRMPEYQGKKLRLLTHGELEIPGQDNAMPPSDSGLAGRIATQLGDAVSAVRMSARMRESASCLVYGDHDPSSRMRRMLAANGRTLPHAAPVLELNPNHALIQQAEQLGTDESLADIARLLLDQAHLSEGTLPADPTGFVQAVNRLLLARSTGSD